jgi:antitoxin VapB
MTATAKIFMNGRSQAVRLPKEFRFKCKEVLITKKRGRVYLRPKVEDPGEEMTWEKFYELGPCDDKLNLQHDTTLPPDNHLFEGWADSEGATA